MLEFITIFILVFISSTTGISGEHLEFVDLSSNGVFPTCSSYSASLSVDSYNDPPIRLGPTSTSLVMISHHGNLYLPGYQGPNEPGGSFQPSTYNYIIAPFWTFNERGQVCYEVHNAWSNGPSTALRARVGDFITNYIGTSVSVESLLVVEWNEMRSSQSYSEHGKYNTFQALIAVSPGETFAIFTYKCGLLQWSTNSAVIGFNSDLGIYRNHPFSRNGSVINPISCANYPQSLWSNVVYRIDSTVVCNNPSLYFGCTIRDCIPHSQVCDQQTQCVDGSDEIACSPVVNCPSAKFACHNGDCIDSGRQCDSFRDCADGSDELACSSSAGQTAGIVLGSLLLLMVLLAIVIAFTLSQVKHRNRRHAQFQALRTSRPAQTTPPTQSVHFHPMPGEWYQTVQGTMVQGPPPAYQEGQLVGGVSEDGPAIIELSQQQPAGPSQPQVDQESSHDPVNEVGVATDESESETTQLIIES